MSDETKSLREAILSFNDYREELVTVPEWGGVQFLIRGMSGTARAEMLQRAVNPDTGEMEFGSLYPEVIIASALDPFTHEPIFQAGDRGALNSKSGGVLERLARTAMRLSGLDGQAEERLGKD